MSCTSMNVARQLERRFDQDRAQRCRQSLWRRQPCGYGSTGLIRTAAVAAAAAASFAAIPVATAQEFGDYGHEPTTVTFPDDTCPAGAAGDSCRRGGSQTLGDLVGGASRAKSIESQHEWRAFPGCAIPAGDDVADPELLTVEAAKRRCGELDGCVAFTFEGNDPDGPLSGSPAWVHLKSKFDCADAEWIAYRKIEGKSRRAVSPPPPPSPPKPVEAEEDILAAPADSDGGDGVALCLSGQVRMLQTTAAAMSQNLLAVLSPDVFMYGPTDRNTPEGPDLYDLKDYVVASRWEDEDIRKHLYAETRNPGRTIELDYVEVQGNWFGNQCLTPALRDNRPGSAICMYYNQQKCLDMVLEKEAERGRPYAWVVLSRTDFRWVAPHPPLDMLTKDAVWIPSGSDWEGGLNDRHAVMRRKHVEHYLSAWPLITRGQAKDVMLETLGSMKVMGYPGPNTECFLRARLQHFKVPVERFPNVAFLTCTQRTKSRWTQCSGTASNDAPGWLYKEEMEHATRVAKCVRASWDARKMEECADDITHLYRGIR